MKKIKTLVALSFLPFSLVGCGSKSDTRVKDIIKQAETMTFDELCTKAIEESNGKTFNAEGNSSRGKTALESFVPYLQKKNADYKLTFNWTQPKNNTIFEDLKTDNMSSTATKSMTLIQDGNQIENKMVKTGILDRFIPKEWATANNTTADDYKGYLPLQTLNKVFMYNTAKDSTKEFKNIWDFVAEDNRSLFMDIDSEVVGKNFLYMLTKENYVTKMKEAYTAMPEGAAKTRIEKTANDLTSKVTELKLSADAKYSLAWIKLWVNQYKQETDDGPICKTIVKDSSKDTSGLLVYSKLRSVEETAESSVNNVKVAAYNDDYKGLGGYGYCHYLFVTDKSPLPWTACALISYMTTTQEGFEPWGKDMGGYSSNPTVLTANEEKHKHTEGKKAPDDWDTATKGTYDKNGVTKDKGYTWWKDKLAIEDPEYCASVAFTVGGWIETLTKGK